MNFRSLIFTLLICAPWAYAEGPIEVPASIKMDAGRMTMITASSKGKEILRWVNPNPKLDLLEFEEGRKIVLNSPVDGEYPIYVYTAVDGVPTVAVKCLVQVGKPAPLPPAPPGPNPPSPPAPSPVDPKLLKDLKDLFDKDGTQFDLKVKAMADLSKLYEKASKVVMEDKSITTVLEFSEAINNLAKEKPVDCLEGVRMDVAERFSKILGKDGSASLTDDARKAASTLFKNIALATKEVIK